MGAPFVLRGVHACGVCSAAVLAAAGFSDVDITIGGRRLSDHYDPRSRTLTLSPDVGSSNSLAALEVAAHESGHALQ